MLWTDEIRTLHITTSIKGDRYTTVAHNYNINAIMVLPLHPDHGTIFYIYLNPSLKPFTRCSLHTNIPFDNEAPKLLKECFKKERLAFK